MYWSLPGPKNELDDRTRCGKVWKNGVMSAFPGEGGQTSC